jgi:hypothetical protein
LTTALREIDSEYHRNNGLKLLMTFEPPELIIKPYTSFIDKTFRRNVLENRNWKKENEPHEPERGWYLPDKCHERINDLVRTTIVVKYLDGVAFLWKKIEQLAGRFELPCRIYYEAREVGYYGAHVYIEPTIRVPGRGIGVDFPTDGGQRESGVFSEQEETHQWPVSARHTRQSLSSRP